jgi:hypothetical protein
VGVNLGLTSLDVAVLAIDPASPATVYAGTAAGVFRSTDAGATWLGTNAGLSGPSVDALVIDPSNPSIVYAGVYGFGVFKSADAGGTWAAANEGLTNRWTMALAIDPTGSTLHAGLVRDGAWERRASNSAFHTVPACRAVDSRTSDGPALAAGTTRTFTFIGKCEIPPDATTVSLNLTVTDATSPGHIRLYPGNAALPSASSLNFSAGDTRANNAFALLGAAGDLAVFSAQDSGSVNVIIDVSGYFR